MDHATVVTLGVASRERRRHGRAGTRRSAVYARVDRPGVLTRAVVENVSLTGVRLVCRAPEPVGASIEIEIGPHTGEKSLILVRGRVAYVKALPDGEYAMGVRLVVPARTHRAVDASAIGHPGHAQALLDRIENALLRQPAEGPFPVAVVEHLRGDAAGPSQDPAKERSTRRRCLFLLLLGLLLLVAALGYLFRRDIRATSSAIARDQDQVVAMEQRLDAADGLTGAFGLFPTDDKGEDIAQASANADASLPLLDIPPAEFDTGGILAEGASETLAALASPQRGAASPAEVFILRFEEAYALAASGETQTGVVLLEDILTSAQEVDPLWRERAAVLLQALTSGNPSSGLPAPMRDAFDIEPFRPVAPLEPVLSIVVNKSDHTLAVYRDGAPVARFPVGLGQGGTTPTGRFHIANKIVDPDWYHRGEIIKAGDPANPLGAYWLGLGDASGPTSYGIHPTAESASIGHDASRGCIRMFPEDAAALFHICDIGTPVVIE